MAAGAQALPELATVRWRPLVDERGLRRRGRMWTATTVAHTVPFLAAAALLIFLQPLALPVALIAIAHAWVVPALYAQRGANVVRPKRPAPGAPPPIPGSEAVALGLLGDLVGHDARALLERTGLVLERGDLGIWLVGEAGALLVRPGGRQVMCWCVGTSEPGLPGGDRIAHLLLALRADERGFATVANLAFCGARRRLRPRLPHHMRAALRRAAELAGPPPPGTPTGG